MRRAKLQVCVSRRAWSESRPIRVSTALGAMLAALLAALWHEPRARAQAPLVTGLGGPVGYGTQCLGKNDDGSSHRIDITPWFPAGLRFFDRTHTALHVNTNGNVSFSGPVPTYTPEPFPVADQPMIAPFWADVDIRHRTGGWLAECDGPPDGDETIGPPCHNPPDNGVWWHFEPGRAVFTWDRVGYYQCRHPPGQRMSFQLILTAATGCTGPGDFDVEFRYNRCEWETGDASGGTGGFGGTPAQAGFDAGNERDFVMIEGSRTAGIARRLCTESNVGEHGVWRFQIRSGVVMCPGAGEECDTGRPGVCALGRVQCVGMGTECRQDVEPSAERCDGLDNDCDGETDEGEGLCPPLQICDRGVCVAACFEGGCPDGWTCTPRGCIEAACLEVDCPAGQRCVAGRCVGACDGVRCPAGRSCRAGRCVDLCATTTCDECTVCVDGACVPRCRYAPCRSGESCLEDGRCVETACTLIACDPGFVCRGGACVDACEGAICPRWRGVRARRMRAGTATGRRGRCTAARRGSRCAGCVRTRARSRRGRRGGPRGRRTAATSDPAAPGGMCVPFDARRTRLLDALASRVARGGRARPGPSRPLQATAPDRSALTVPPDRSHRATVSSSPPPATPRRTWMVPLARPLSLRGLGSELLRSAGDRLVRLAEESLGVDIDARIARLRQHPNEVGVDPFGFDPRAARHALAIAAFLHRWYFRTEVHDIDRLPEGRCIVVANHGGQLPFDGLVLGTALVLDAEPPRFPRSMVEKWSAELPFVSVLFPRLGQVVGAPDNARRLLRNDETLLVFPEGSRGISKTFDKRYQLVEFGHGFMRLALETDTPIVPVAIIGSEEQLPSVANLERVARLLGMPAFPVLPQLLVGLWGPLPVRYRLYFGEPLRFSGDPDEDDRVLEPKVAIVRQTLQSLLHRGLRERRSVFF
ncbi:MAG: 1-acyl-sn-glycerol-3-phosphate acyltransferase [Myxococcota bacterium]|nr:1-acyl-sn-glycerol-3-phosphate acyltransferase [Myxococcota bacterium]